MQPMIRAASFLRSAVVLTLAFAWSVEAAGTGGWFGGIGNFGSTSEIESSNFYGGVSDGNYSRKIFTAYRVSRNWGLQMGTDFDYYSRQLFANDAPATMGNKARGWEFSGTGTLPLGQKFGVVGKVGAYRGELGVAPSLSSNSEDKTRPTFGLGVKYDLTRNFRLQGGWDRYRVAPAVPSDKDENVDLLSIGLKYRF